MPDAPHAREQLTLDEMLRVMDVATELRKQRETVEKEFAVDETKQMLRERLLAATSITGERVSEGEVDTAITQYFGTLYTYRELLSSTMDSYLSQVNNRLAFSTKALSVVATLSLPFVVVSGMWGMNFTHIPLSNWPHGFWVIVVVQLGLGLALLYFLRRRKLL